MRLQSTVVCALMVLGAVSARNVDFSKRNEASKLSPGNNTYLPCKAQVAVFFDVTTDISSDNYLGLQIFLSKHFFKRINHFERVELGIFAGADMEARSFGRYENLKSVQTYINEQKQIPFIAYSDYVPLFEVLTTLDFPLDMPKSVILVTGRLSADDAEAAKPYAEMLKESGVFLSIIGVQRDVDAKALDTLADYGYVFDLNQGIPNGIQNMVGRAMGCN